MNGKLLFFSWIFTLGVLLVLTEADGLSTDAFLTTFNYSVRSPSFNVSNYTDFMSDDDGNGLPERLSINISFAAIPGTYSIFTDLVVNNSLITSSANVSIPSAAKAMLNYSTKNFEGTRFNYTIRIYDTNASLKFREAGIVTNSYASYQLGYNIINISDAAANTSLILNVTLNVTSSFALDATAFLRYNSSTLTSSVQGNVTPNIAVLSFAFDNESIKKTHYIGNYTFYQLKLNSKAYAFNYSTRVYDYRNFAQSAFIYNATDTGIDADANGLLDALRLNFSISSIDTNTYKLEITVYDLYFRYIKQITKSQTLNPGTNYLVIDVNGTDIYKRKLTGPYLVYPKLKLNAAVLDAPPRYVTAQYNFTQFEKSDSPELYVLINTSKDHLYGRRNATVNVTIGNNGSIRGYNLFLDVFDNYSLSQTFFISTLFVNNTKTYMFNFTNMSDRTFTAIVDLQNVIEEANESDNSQQALLKVNKAPLVAGNPSYNPNVTSGTSFNFSINYSDDDNVSIRWFVDGNMLAINSSNYTFTGQTAGNFSVLVNISDGFLSNTTAWNVTVTAAVQSASATQSSTSTGSIDSSSGGDGALSIACNKNIVCAAWSACQQGKQTRTCKITKACNVSVATEQNCNESGRVSDTASAMDLAAATPSVQQANSPPAFLLSDTGIIQNEYVAAREQKTSVLTGAAILGTISKLNKPIVLLSSLAVFLLIAWGFYWFYNKP